MSVTAMSYVLTHSPSKGNARLVEVAMAHIVIEERVSRGEPALVWASQNTLAAMCRCSRSTIERSLDELKRLGRILDTGERRNGRYRGTVVYELLLDDPDLTDPGSGDVTHPGSRQPGSGETSQNGSGTVHLTHSGDDLTDSAQAPASTVTHKQVVEEVVEEEEEQVVDTGPATESRDVHSSSTGPEAEGFLTAEHRRLVEDVEDFEQQHRENPADKRIEVELREAHAELIAFEGKIELAEAQA